MNHFDSSILLWLNQFAGRSHNFDAVVQFLSDSEIFKGEIFLLVIWWFWFGPQSERMRNRQIIAATFVAALMAIVVGRVMAMFLPFRVRPAFNPDLALVYHQEVANGVLRTWSAFPSDHAMMFAALATGLYFISPTIGLISFAYALIVIDLPRVYLGLHHPTDVLFGALIGAIVGVACNYKQIRNRISLPVEQIQVKHEGAFYALFFFISAEIVTMFSEPRTIVMAMVRLAKGHL